VYLLDYDAADQLTRARLASTTLPLQVLLDSQYHMR